MTRYIVFLPFALFLFSCSNNNASQNVKHIGPQQIAKLKVDIPELKIIDLRTPEEIVDGKIDQEAFEIDFYAKDFEEQLNRLNKDQSYLIYCRSGGRSGKAIPKMKKLGFTSIYHLDGGYSSWLKSN